MNIVISGPFGMGSLADEAVLAGLLKHVSSEKNSVSVLTFDSEKTKRIHNVPTVTLQSPSAFITNMEVWRLLEKAHLFVLASAGPISVAGKQPARNWLAQLEHAQRAGAKTAIVGAGALPVTEARERARIQRFLQLNTDAISTRDAETKLTVITYGMNSNRVSFNGDPTLALAAAPVSTPGSAIGIVLAQNVPSRDGFGFDAKEVSPALRANAEQLVATLLKETDAALKIFHDDTDVSRAVGASLRKVSAERISLHTCDAPFQTLMQTVNECGSIFSFSLHGLIFGAAAGVPVTGLREELGAAEFLESIGLRDFVLSAPLDPSAAAGALKTQLSRATDLRELLQKRLSMLKKKESQNARMLKLLVPRRISYERDLQGVGKPLPKKQHKPKTRGR
jgi:polysaccharide pyruvyl transferase WcaK-like protein